MKNKLRTRFPAARIKKIMQTDDDVGKIATAVPLLISKALELFLQDLCDRVYEETSDRAAKTVTSSHLKRCVERFVVFDFLGDVVSKVPDLCDPSKGDDPLNGTKRKRADFEDGNCVEQSARMRATAKKGKGRGQGSNRAIKSYKFEDDPDISDFETTTLDYEAESQDIKPYTTSARNTSAPVRNIDLNLDLDEDGNTLPVSVVGSNEIKDELEETVKEECRDWSFGEAETVNPLNGESPMLGCLNQATEDDENYDVE